MVSCRLRCGGRLSGKMVQTERIRLAREKEAFARQLFEAGESPATAREAIAKRFGKNLSGTTLYQIHRDVTGKARRLRRRKKAVRKKRPVRPVRKKAPVETSLVPIDIPPGLIPRQPSSPAVDALLRTLCQAMRSEGVSSIVLDYTGSARISHITEREINVMGG